MISKSTWNAVVVTAALVASAAAPSAWAQAPGTVVISTAVRTILPGHVVTVTFADEGRASTSAVSVQVELLDAANRVLARGEGRVRSGEPLVVHWAGQRAATQVHAIARFAQPATAATALRAASVSVESWNPATNGDLVCQSCLAKGPNGNDAGGSGPIAYCPDGTPMWEVAGPVGPVRECPDGTPTWLVANLSTDGPCILEIGD